MMSQARFDRTLSEQTASARKVFEAVPFETPVSSRAIQAELMRMGRRIDLNIVEGCLKVLVANEVVYQNKRLDYVRAPVRAVQAKEPKESEMAQMSSTVKVEPVPPLLKLMRLSESLVNIATEIENVVAEIEAQNKANLADMAKFQQFKNLIKEL